MCGDGIREVAASSSGRDEKKMFGFQLPWICLALMRMEMVVIFYGDESHG